MNKDENKWTPPNFTLADLKSYDISALKQGPTVSEDNAFIIASSTAYNDLKDYFWIYSLLSEHSPDDKKKIDPQTGQWNGMNIFCIRKIIATFFEFIELIKKNEKILNSERIKDTELYMGDSFYEAWDKIKQLAISNDKQLSEKDSFIYNAILRIRNNISSHYYGTKNFGNGFKLYSENAEAKAYLSLGTSMEATRFFYADAATQCTLDKILDENKIEINDVFNFIINMNKALRAFIDCYLQISSGSFKMNRDLRRKFKSKRTRKPKVKN